MAGKTGEGGKAMREVVAALASRGITVSCAESLTGGLLANAFVEVPGASEVFLGAVCAYATDSKATVLGVDPRRLAFAGPVDGDVALDMAVRVRELFGADVGLSTTGVAGPGPADGHEAGAVWVAISGMGEDEAAFHRLRGDRQRVRRAAVGEAIGLLSARLR